MMEISDAKLLGNVSVLGLYAMGIVTVEMGVMNKIVVCKQ